MSTRSLTVIVDTSWDRTKEICVMYQQCDGYPSGHGAELKEFLLGMKIINGIPGDPPKKFANGIPCLAAQLIGHFKRDQAGGYYLHAAGTRNCGEEYTYTVTGAFDEPLELQVESRNGVIYKGSVEGFDPEMEESEDAA